MFHLITVLSCSLIVSCAFGFIASDLDDYQCVDFVPHVRVRRQEESTFRCGNDSSLINIEKMCDGQVDCSDESDESLACTKLRCPRYLFTCKYGACINSNLKCDGKQDCRDNSDETHPDCTNIIPAPPAEGCNEGELRCNNGECIDESYECDGKAQCSDQSDETSERCANFKCPFYLFKCDYGACINKNLRCNGVNDCFDGSDEARSLCGDTSVRPVTPSRPEPTTPSTPTRGPPSRYPGGCQVPRPPDFGRWFLLNRTPLIQLPGEYVAETTVIVEKCDKGYSLDASEQILWCYNGTWSRSVGRCVKTCPSLTKNTKINIESCQKNGVPADCSNPFPETSAVVKCIPYYEDPNLERIPFIKCGTGGDWNYQPKCSPICGKETTVVTELINGGRPAKRGNYPWQVALYEKFDDEQILQCGGCIINERVVLTAAHCVTVRRRNKIEKKDNDALTVAAGKYYRPFNDDRDAEEAQFLKVLEIHIPEGYNGDSALYAADIAILILDGSLELTKYIQPACIDWGTKTDPTMEQPGKKGVVTGWGYTTRGGNESEVLKELVVPYIRREECERNLPPKYLEYLLYDKFCSGFIDQNTGVCQGDSGGPLVFRNQDNKFYVRGVVSISPQSEGNCDPNEYAIYTAVSNHISFVSAYEGAYPVD